MSPGAQGASSGATSAATGAAVITATLAATNAATQVGPNGGRARGKYDVILIGAGVNGLTAAAYLARAGRRVLVLEQRESLGGLCATEEFHPGFRANTCVDDPGWILAAVERELDLAKHGYSSTLAATSVTVPRSGRAPLLISGDPAATARGLQEHAPRDAARWGDFCMLVARLSGFLEALYSARTPIVESTAPADLLALLSLGRRLRGLGRRGIIELLRTVPMPIADLLEEWFDDETLRAALAVAGVANVQHGPQSGGTSLVFLNAHVGLPAGYVRGRRIVRGGVGRLPEALAAAARASGAEVRTGVAVTQILARDDRARGVVLSSGDELEATAVVSSADPRRTFTTLLDPALFDPEFLHAVDQVRMRGPAARIHLALSRLPAFATAGTPWTNEALQGAITVAPTMWGIERAYDAAKHRGVAEEPWAWATMPSLGDPSLAPPGQHVMSIQLQYAAHDVHGGWTAARRDALGDAAVRLFAEHAPDLTDAIVGGEVLTPDDIAQRYGATQGNLMHGELALDQFLFMRPTPECARYATPLEGLWLCGSGTHPGAGTAGASGRLAAREILAATAK